MTYAHCYIQQFKRRCIYKKIHSLTLTLVSHETLPSTLYIMWPMHLQSLKRFRRRYIYKKIHYLTLGHDLGVEVSWNIAQYPLHYVTFATAKFEVAMSNSLWGDAFSRKYIIWSCPWSQGHTKHCPVPSTSCYLCTCKVWSCYVQQFWRRCNSKKHDIRTHRQTDRRRTDFGTKLI